MILNTGKENVSKKNSRVLKTTGSSVGVKNSTVLKEVTFNSWCFAHILCKESLM